ncbi:MAG: NAD(P)-dependent oxidoreductase [Bacteroidales bacterium]|nr:NAD(P)-dependent oxidoreductase [Bacteroidales bacterium]
MKIAITGASGLLGRCLLDQMQNHEVLLMGRSLQKLKEIYNNRPDTRLYETDYSQESLSEILAPADALIHFAARPTSKLFTNYDEYYWKIQLAEKIFKVCKSVGIKNAVFASSAMLYSPKVNTVPYVESEPIYPETLYAVCKMAIENLGFLHVENFKSLRIALITLSERRGIMLGTFIQQAIRKQTITIYGEGIGVREMIYVKDAAAAIEAAINAPEQKGVFNIGSGVATSHNELADLVNEIFAWGSAEIVHDLSKHEASTRYPMDHGKAGRLLGWNPKYTAEQALTELKPEILASVVPDEISLEKKSTDFVDRSSRDDISGKIFA